MSHLALLNPESLAAPPAAEPLYLHLPVTDPECAGALSEMQCKMSRRLASATEAGFCMDEIKPVEVPAFLRRKLEEGRGRRKP